MSDTHLGKHTASPDKHVDSLDEHIERVLIGPERIRQRVRELGREITVAFGGEEITIVCILKGAFLFMSDLCREIACPQQMGFMAVSSYGHATESSGVVRIVKDLDDSIEGRNVLIVEDIVDTGLTLSYLARILRDRHPKSLKICVLCSKKQNQRCSVPIDFNGFELPDEFVVGYGLDFHGFLRNLPYIGVLKPEYYDNANL